MTKAVKKYLHEYTVDQVINSVGLYQKMYISINLPPNDKKYLIANYEKMVSDDTKIFNDLIQNIKNIRTYCIECCRENTFHNNGQNLYGNSIFPFKSIELQLNALSEIVTKEKIVRYALCQEEYFNRIYQCAYNKEHSMIIHYKLDSDGEELVLQKIGQYPSISELQFPEFKRYEDILYENDYLELEKALDLYASGIGVGSFVYLRRIYENLIESIHQEYYGNSNLDEKIYKGLVFDKKIAKLESLGANIFPDAIQDLKAHIYSILGEGIHGYDENECMNLFEPLKFCIESILDQKYEKEERRKKAEAAKKAFLNKQ